MLQYKSEIGISIQMLVAKKIRNMAFLNVTLVLGERLVPM